MIAYDDRRRLTASADGCYVNASILGEDVVLRMTVLAPAGRLCRTAAVPVGSSVGPTIKDRTKRFGLIAWAACLASLVASAAASAQQTKSPQPPSQVTALVVMTPTGPATCATWVKWRAPGADPADKAAIEYWAEGCLSGVAAGSHHDVIDMYRHEIARTRRFRDEQP